MSLPKDKRRLRGLMRRAARESLSRHAADLAAYASGLAFRMSVVRAVRGDLATFDQARELALDGQWDALWRAELRRLSKRVRRAPR